MSRFRVCVVTGTRAEFGIWRSVLAAIEQSKRLELQLVVTGMHLLPQFGDTIRAIEAAPYKISARAPMYEEGGDSAGDLARGIGNLATAFDALRPNIVLVLGDRLEMLAAGCTALARRVPIGHVHGGETAPGIWDEQIRHALSKMAQVHFCATEATRRRLLRMGEQPNTVHQVGAPALDNIEYFWMLNGPIAGKVRSYRRRGVRGDEAVLLLHPSGGTAEEEYERTRLVLGALADMRLIFQCVGPNNDPGHEGILRAYEEAGVKVEMNHDQGRFWHLVVYSSVLVGNSSSGIIEAASLGVPVVNVGSRQAGRERNANVIDVPWQRAAVAQALEKSLHDAAFRRLCSRRKNLYGDGKAAGRIVAVLEKLAETGIPLEKRFFNGPGA